MYLSKPNAGPNSKVSSQATGCHQKTGTTFCQKVKDVCRQSHFLPLADRQRKEIVAEGSEKEIILCLSSLTSEISM